jgi:hypothetical protein
MFHNFVWGTHSCIMVCDVLLDGVVLKLRCFTIRHEQAENQALGI